MFLRNCLIGSLLFARANVARAQDVDVVFSGASGALRITPGPDGLVFNGPLGETIPFYGDEPGFISENNSLPGNTPVSFNVLASLLYWNGTQFTTVPAGENLEMFDATFGTPLIDITQSSGAQPGFVLHNTDPNGFIHNHPGRYLQTPGGDDPAVGGYGTLLQLIVPGLTPSEPFIIMYNNGLDDASFHDGIVAAANYLPEPASLPSFGAMGLVLVRNARVRRQK